MAGRDSSAALAAETLVAPRGKLKELELQSSETLNTSKKYQVTSKKNCMIAWSESVSPL